MEHNDRTNTGKKSGEPVIQSVDRALSILDLLGKSGKPETVTELSRAMGLHKSTVSRFLSTMAHHRLVEQDSETQKYKLGIKLLELSNSLLSNFQLRSEAMPYLRELSELAQEVAHLGVLSDGEVVYIEKVEGPSILPMYSQIGRRVSVHSTAMGKAILAFLPPEESRKVLEQKGVSRKTANTITSIEELMVHLDLIRLRGYSEDNEENEIGIRCIGAPILDFRSNVVAAISVSGPTSRMDNLKCNNLGPHVRRIGMLISQRFGYQGDCN